MNLKRTYFILGVALLIAGVVVGSFVGLMLGFSKLGLSYMPALSITFVILVLGEVPIIAFLIEKLGEDANQAKSTETTGSVEK